MGSMSLWHWLIVGALALVLFGGKGKISDLMGDVAKGIKSFKKGMAEEDADVKPAPEQSRTIDHAPAAPVQTTAQAGTTAATAQPSTSANEPAKVG